MLLLARTSLFALTTGTRALRTSVPRMAVQVPRPNLGSSSESEAAYTLDGGYALAPGEDSTGGWLAHRSQLDVPGSGPGDDWVRRVFDDPDGDLASAANFSPGTLTHPPRILLLYGSLRETSFSRRLAHECARILELLGADVRVYDPRGLPVRDPELESHPKVQELRSLSAWSEAHVWVSPEMHGTLTGAFKNQIDWLPLNSGSVRPTQGRACAVLQVNGGSQSFNAVNELRRLARWMRMVCTTNQSSVPKAWQEFDDDGRMKHSSLRERVVDVMEEHIKVTRLIREHADYLVDRYSERLSLTRTSRGLSTVRTGYAYQPPACCTYQRRRAAGAPPYVRCTRTSLRRALRTAYRGTTGERVEVAEKGRLLTQEEKEREKVVEAARSA